MGHPLQRDDLLYPELSYRIIGAAYEVFNELGPGMQERTYQRAFANELRKRGIHFAEQVYVPVKYKDEVAGTYYLDFVFEDKIVGELKCGDYFRPQNIRQVVNYLKMTGYVLALLINFTREGVRQKRILNMDKNHDSDIRTDS